MLKVDNTVLVVVDVQEKLANAMHDRDFLIENIVRLVKGAQILGLPIILSEQNPKGLGFTIPAVGELLSGSKPITKLSFSCCGQADFMSAIASAAKNQVLICGIESHVCVYQTVADLLNLGYEVHVVADAVSSRTPENRQMGLEKCKGLGASVTSVETALFEILKIAEGNEFKQMLKVVK